MMNIPVLIKTFLTTSRAPALPGVIPNHQVDLLKLLQINLYYQSSVKYVFFLFVTYLLSCKAAKVYDDPNTPVYYHNEKRSGAINKNDSLNVITFNIKKAEKTALAILELENFEKTRNVDVYLLQEMDQNSVVAIASKLHLNYLYFPIAFDKKEIGNAILTRGTIAHPEKLILPHSKRLSKRLRCVTIGQVTINQMNILVYSVHTETVMMTRKHRMAQIDAILEHATTQLPNYQYVLIGGDFNTLFTKDSQLAVQKFNTVGFDWSTAKVGSTARAFSGLIKPTHDYFFSKGLHIRDAYKIATSKSSDHYPVFATFGF